MKLKIALTVLAILAGFVAGAEFGYRHGFNLAKQQSGLIFDAYIQCIGCSVLPEDGSSVVYRPDVSK